MPAGLKYLLESGANKGIGCPKPLLEKLNEMKIDNRKQFLKINGDEQMRILKQRVNTTRKSNRINISPKENQEPVKPEELVKPVEPVKPENVKMEDPVEPIKLEQPVNIKQNEPNTISPSPNPTPNPSERIISKKNVAKVYNRTNFVKKPSLFNTNGHNVRLVDLVTGKYVNRTGNKYISTKLSYEGNLNSLRKSEGYSPRGGKYTKKNKKHRKHSRTRRR
jgi:hypothetical protein